MQDSVKVAGEWTLAEIKQQPELWSTTLDRVEEFIRRRGTSVGEPACITGAGTSAFAAATVAAAWRNAIAKPTTDLLTDDFGRLVAINTLVSLGRSGDSPESAAVLKRLMRVRPDVKHLAITCNAQGFLARTEGVEALVLDPRTNDRSLAMTSSFSNLALAGMALQHLPILSRELPLTCERFDKGSAEMRASAAVIAARKPSRVAFLGSGPLFSAAQEGALKILEMTAGRVVTQAETFLGVRHGPMSFLRGDTVVVCLLSSDRGKRRFEEDVIEELQQKQLGYLVGIADESWCENGLQMRIAANAPKLPDYLRTPFEILFAQLLAFELSLGTGLDPDNPSPGGIITRVVRGFRIHESV